MATPLISIEHAENAKEKLEKRFLDDDSGGSSTAVDE